MCPGSYPCNEDNELAEYICLMKNLIHGDENFKTQLMKAVTGITNDDIIG